MTNMYTIKENEVYETVDIMNSKKFRSIKNDGYFMNSYFFGISNGTKRANDIDIAYIPMDMYDDVEKNDPYFNIEYYSEEAQTLENVYNVMYNKGIGFLNVHDNNEPYIIIMRNLIGYILYNCNPDHYEGIFQKYKQVIENMLKQPEYNETIIQIVNDIDRVNVDNANEDVKYFLERLLRFVNKVLSLFERNDLKEHVILDKFLTEDEMKIIDSQVPLLQNIVNQVIQKHSAKKEDLKNMVYYKSIFESVFNSIIQTTELDQFAKMFQFKKEFLTVDPTITNKLKKRTDLVLDYKLYYVAMAMVMNNLTLDERNKFNYVEPMKYAIEKYKSIAQYRSELYDIYSNTLTTIPDKFSAIMNKYIDCFKNFVFFGDAISLGLGAYLISLIILPYLQYEWIEDQSLSLNTDLSVYHELTCFDSIYSYVEHTITTGNSVECFHQSPYMLGFFSTINPHFRAGTCQDNALIKIINLDKTNKLYGMSMTNHPKITHWIAIGSDDKSSVIDTYSHAFFVTHNGIKNIETVGKMGDLKKQKFYENATEDTTNFRSNNLMESDIQLITKTNYQARANVFLAMTMAHVYRHTKDPNGENDKNGVAFQRTPESSFEKAVLEFISENIPMKHPKDYERKTKVQKFNFDDLKMIFDRTYEAILKSLQENKQRIRRNSALYGGKNNKSLYKKVGKFNNRTIYKKNNTCYMRVKDANNKYIYKKITKSMCKI